jgi:hypothetical protein
MICDGAFKLSAPLLYTVVNKNKKCPLLRVRGQSAKEDLGATRPSDLITQPGGSVVLPRVSVLGLARRTAREVLLCGGQNTLCLSAEIISRAVS